MFKTLIFHFLAAHGVHFGPEVTKMNKTMDWEPNFEFLTNSSNGGGTHGLVVMCATFGGQSVRASF